LHASLVVGVCLLGCSSDDSSPTASGGGGGSGAGGAATAAGAGGASPGLAGTSAGMGGSAGGGGGEYDARSDPAFGLARPCPTPEQALVTGFTPPAGAEDAGADAGVVVAGATFGNFPVTLSGGTFTYPNAPGDPFGVNSDVSTGEWHLSGNIGTYSGFGLYFTGCNRIDASDYLGLSFSVRGNVAMGDSLTFSVATSSNDVSFLWLNSQPTPPNPLAEPNSGRCIPAVNPYDGTCVTPSFSVPVTATETTVEVLWASLTGGSPSPSVDPSEITSIGWSFPPPAGAGTATPTAYAVDLFIDNLAFISP
jgi:hypothetical protein